jgi:hypothetical protein
VSRTPGGGVVYTYLVPVGLITCVVGTGSLKIVCIWVLYIYLSAGFLSVVSWYSYLRSPYNIEGIFFVAFCVFLSILSCHSHKYFYFLKNFGFSLTLSGSQFYVSTALIAKDCFLVSVLAYRDTMFLGLHLAGSLPRHFHSSSWTVFGFLCLRSCSMCTRGHI